MNSSGLVISEELTSLGCSGITIIRSPVSRSSYDPQLVYRLSWGAPSGRSLITRTRCLSRYNSVLRRTQQWPTGSAESVRTSSHMRRSLSIDSNTLRHRNIKLLLNINLHSPTSLLRRTAPRGFSNNLTSLLMLRLGRRFYGHARGVIKVHRDPARIPCIDKIGTRFARALQDPISLLLKNNSVSGVCPQFSQVMGRYP